MKILKIYIPYVAVCAALLTGNLLPCDPPDMPVQAVAVTLDDDDDGFFIFDTKFVRPPRPGANPSADDAQAVATILAAYGQ